MRICLDGHASLPFLAPPAEIISAVSSPAVVVDLAQLRRNIESMALQARGAGVSVRPHVKTHKSVEIARLQMAVGAVGITVAKTSEAAIFISAGIADVMVAQPVIDREKICRLLGQARDHGATVRFIADSLRGVSALADAATRLGAAIDIHLKVDVGLHRCGVDPLATQAMEVAEAIVRHPLLTFSGILSHAGHAYAAPSSDAVREIARNERENMITFAEQLSRVGIEVPAISVGCTPTIYLNAGFGGLTEIRPGNYVFMDLTQIALGVTEPRTIALHVVATVVSRNERYAIIDAGSKVLSSDRGPHGSTLISGHGLALTGSVPLTVERLSEEHGFIAHRGSPLAVGEKVAIVPNHSCPVVNLAKEIVVYDHARTIARWPVDARACVE